MLRAAEPECHLAVARVPQFDEASAKVAEHIAGGLNRGLFVVVHAHEGHLQWLGGRRKHGGDNVDPRVTDGERAGGGGVVGSRRWHQQHQCGHGPGHGKTL